MEDGLRKAIGTQVQLARIDIIGTLKRAEPPASNLTQSEWRAIKSLQRDDSIIILPADKGKATVILDKENYNEK